MDYRFSKINTLSFLLDKNLIIKWNLHGVKANHCAMNGENSEYRRCME